MHTMSAREYARPLTIAEYQQLPEEPGYRHELADGRLVREPQPHDEQGWLVIELGARLRDVVKRTRAGYLVTESGFVLKEQPPTVRGPDLAFIARERAPTFPLRGYHRLGPDLVVEVLSPSDRAANMQRKVDEYFRAGSRLVWLVDPRARTVLVHTSAHETVLLTERDVLTGGDVLPELTIRLSELFTL
jgi:Uma2 family endonuclease